MSTPVKSTRTTENVDETTGITIAGRAKRKWISIRNTDADALYISYSPGITPEKARAVLTSSDGPFGTDYRGNIYLLTAAGTSNITYEEDF